MFKNPFSFSGRIRRLEFALSYAIFYGVIIVSGGILGAEEEASLMYLPILIVGSWFLLAQRTKRCHDLGNSGFYQLIPFYVLVMLFEEGRREDNKYGINPKDPRAEKAVRPKFEWKVTLPPLRTYGTVLNEIIAMSLANVLLLALFNELNPNEVVLFLLMTLTVSGSYLLLLALSHNAKKLPKLPSYFLWHRVAYITFIFLFFRLYLVAFRNFPYSENQFFIDAIGAFVFIGIAFFVYTLYKLTFTSPS